MLKSRGLNLHFFDALVGLMPVNRLYFGVANPGLPLRPINQVIGFTLGQSRLNFWHLKSM